MVKGRVAVMKEYGKPFELQEYEVPDPEPGAMVLRMTQSGYLRLRPAQLEGRPGQAPHTAPGAEHRARGGRGSV